EFIKIAKCEGLSPFPGVVEIFTELRRRGIKTALATSSKQKELDTVQQTAKLDLTKLADELVTSDDADESKPSPDIAAAAVNKAKPPSAASSPAATASSSPAATTASTPPATRPPTPK